MKSHIPSGFLAGLQDSLPQLVPLRTRGQRRPWALTLQPATPWASPWDFDWDQWKPDSSGVHQRTMLDFGRPGVKM